MQSDNLCQFLEWDSEFFGCRIARVTAAGLTRRNAAAVEQWGRDEKIDCLYFMAAAGDSESATLADELRFKCVDIRLDFEKELKSAAVFPSPVTRVRLSRPADVPALRAIAAVSHRDSRFYHDGRFARARCGALYETWIDKSCHGWAASVLVAEHEGAPAGYLSCHLEGAEGRIGLTAVGPQAQGFGLGRALVESALNWFGGQGAGRVSVVTQGRNVKAQRLYQRCGFLTASVHLWYHKWFSPAPGAARAGKESSD